MAYLFASYLRPEQVHIMCSTDELMPSIGTSVPSPLVLAVAVSQSDYTLQDIIRRCPDTDPVDFELDNPLAFIDESHIISKTHLISVSDDGKVWKWLLTAERSRDSHRDSENVKKFANVEVPISEVSSAGQVNRDDVTQPDNINCTENNRPGFSVVSDEVSFKVGSLVQFIFSIAGISFYSFEYLLCVPFCC